jgi:hypothetical protein
MSRGDIVFQKKQGANKRTAPGQDYISGLIFYTASLPSGFTSLANIKQLYSLIDAENAGIVNTYSDETKATATYLITAVGANGDTIALSVVEPFNNTVVLGTYTKVTGDTTVTKVGDGVALVINNGTKDHGYTAVNTGGSVVVTAKSGLGVFLNTTSLIATITGTITATNTAFSGGVASKLAVFHYLIAEYFRMNPNSTLFVGFWAVPSTYTFVEVTQIQAFANGSLRQVGIFKPGVYNSADLTVINTEVVNNNDNRHKPLSVLYTGDLSATTDITTIADLSGLSATKVSSIIGQDGFGQGGYLYKTTGHSVSQLGAALGALSLSAVSEDFGEPAKFNLSDGTENNVPAFANGQLLSDPLIGDNALDAIDGKRQIFGQLYVGYTGTYFNDNHCACSPIDSFAYINDNRVMDKAIRGIYSGLIPYLKGKIIKNADGTIDANTLAFYQTQALAPLYQMERDGDLSAVSDTDVYIDPTQQVGVTGTLLITVLLNEADIARHILIPISYK